MNNMNNFGAAPQFQMGQSSLPIRSAPAPPPQTPAVNTAVPQIMVTQDQDFSIFEGKKNIVRNRAFARDSIEWVPGKLSLRSFTTYFLFILKDAI